DREAIFDTDDTADNKENANDHLPIHGNTPTHYFLLPNHTCKSNSFSKNVHCVHFISPIYKRLIHWVFRFQRYMIVKESYPLQGCVSVNQDSGDFTVVNGRQLPDIDNITIENPGVYHRIAFTRQGKVSVDIPGDVHIILDVF